MDSTIYHKIDPHYRTCWYHRHRRGKIFWLFLSLLIIGFYMLISLALPGATLSQAGSSNSTARHENSSSVVVRHNQ